MGANIINVSLSTRDDTSDIVALRSAVSAAQAAGVIIVAAVGNHSPGETIITPGYPAAYSAEPSFPLVVAVGASNNTNGNTWATYSNYGAAVDLAAPGNDIASTARTDLAPSTGYGVAGKGTSYATPIVSGMFALMRVRNSALLPTDYIEIAKATASPAAPAQHGQNWAGAGIVDIGAAVAQVPLSVSGVAMHDWKDVGKGSVVLALVDENVCGQATTGSPIVATFAMLVKTDAVQAGCGDPGRTVEFLINGLDTRTSISWGGRNVDLRVSGLEVSSVSPPPGTIIVQELAVGWNNIGHLGATGAPETAFAYLPASWEEIRFWDTTGISPGDGGTFRSYSKSLPAYANDVFAVPMYGAVWAYLTEPATVATANPDPALGRTITLKGGWNNFVYTGTSQPVGEALADIDGQYSLVAELDNPTGDWQIYSPALQRFLNDFGGLMRLDTYWVYMTEPGLLTMR